MKTIKKLGRPRKPAGTISDREFVLFGIMTSAYDRARESGLKHSSAVREVVRFVRQHYPKFKASETTVKRILAKMRPRNSRAIIRFEQVTLTKDELIKFRAIQTKLAGKDPEETTRSAAEDPTKEIKVFKFRFAERPTYPRFNGLDPQN